MKEITSTFASFEDTFNKLCNYVTVTKLTPFVECATTAAALITEDNFVFYGVNLKTDCGMGFCAERNAFSTMITAGMNKIKYIMCVDRQHILRLPCGACREYICQMNVQNLEAEVIQSIYPLKTIKIKNLLPNWWGFDKINRIENN